LIKYFVRNEINDGQGALAALYKTHDPDRPANVTTPAQQTTVKKFLTFIKLVLTS